MRLYITGAVLCAALFTHAMHVSSEDEKPQKSPAKCIEMKIIAADCPHSTRNKAPESDSDSDDTQTEPKPFCFGNLNKKSGSLYAHMYTLASVDTDTQEKPK